MPVFFKLSKDGNKALVARTLFDKDLSNEEFKEKAREVATDDLVKRLSKKQAQKVALAKKRLNELDAMKLTEFGTYITSNPCTRTTTVHYLVGDKHFLDQHGEEEEYHEKEEALEYAKKYYGQEFYEKHEGLMNARNEWSCFSGLTEISKEEYKNYMEEMQKLTSVVCLGRNKEQSANVKK